MYLAHSLLQSAAPSTQPPPPATPSLKYVYKSDTDLYALAKAKTVATSLEISPDGRQFVTCSPDRRIRVFWLATGKLRRAYDESLEVRMPCQ